MKIDKSGRSVTRVSLSTLLIATLLLVITQMVLISQVSAHDYKAGDLNIIHPYMSATPPGANVSAGYLEISNEGEVEDRLIGGSATFAENIEIHRTTINNDVVSMRELEEGLAISGNSKVSLEPGGMHLMFVGLDRQLVPGEILEVTLRFARAGEKKVRFMVDKITGHEHADHSN